MSFVHCQAAVITIIGLGGGTLPPLPLQALSVLGITLQGAYVGNRKMLTELLELLGEDKVTHDIMQNVYMLSFVHQRFVFEDIKYCANQFNI